MAESKELVCRECGFHVGLWGGYGEGSYWKHQVSRKLPWPHKPEPVRQSEYDLWFRPTQEKRTKRMIRRAGKVNHVNQRH